MQPYHCLYHCLYHCSSCQSFVWQSLTKLKPLISSETSLKMLPKMVLMNWHRPSLRLPNDSDDSGIPVQMTHSKWASNCEWFEHSGRSSSTEDADRQARLLMVFQLTIKLLIILQNEQTAFVPYSWDDLVFGCGQGLVDWKGDAYQGGECLVNNVYPKIPCTFLVQWLIYLPLVKSSVPMI